MHNYGAGSSSQDVEYQGYPYLNPVVLDVPSISAAAAAKWSNLPRKPIGSTREGPGQAGGSGIQRPAPSVPSLPNPDPRPTVFIDLPQGSGSDVADQRRMRGRPAPSTPRNRFEEPLSPKLDPEPAVFIDLPLGSGSDVAEQRRVQAEDRTYVENTIFYDPFKDRRIAVTPDSDSGSSSSERSNAGPSRPVQTRAQPPNTLNLGPSGGFSSSSYTPIQPGMPPSMAKQAEVYGQYEANEEREFPPAYTEFDTRTVNTPGQISSPTTSVIATSPITATPGATPGELPRTQVIIAATDDMDQKLILCTNCSVRGSTLRVSETGTATHVAAIAFFCVGLIPMTILVYFLDWFKYRNYYCKNCDKKIAYEIPFLCQELTFLTSHDETETT